ncbi:unnamed protein product [Pleuronectes platessa]|uniref:Uncharacterized protein n=1 Tax=Pleuronectes platessa TaxID=8262 RepID=A0A9N7UY67_PLEPL|nr:unnamed protein product [Pleuronectes platessa]
MTAALTSLSGSNDQAVDEALHKSSRLPCKQRRPHRRPAAIAAFAQAAPPSSLPLLNSPRPIFGGHPLRGNSGDATELSAAAGLAPLLRGRGPGLIGGSTREPSIRQSSQPGAPFASM